MHKQDCEGGQQVPDGVQASSTLRGSLEVWFWRAAGDRGWTLRKAPTAPRKPSWRRNMADISPCIAARPGQLQAGCAGTVLQRAQVAEAITVQ